MIKSIINTKNINDADVVILSASYDKTASSQLGTVYGPKAVVKSLNTQIEFFDRKSKKEMTDHINTAHVDLGNLNKFSPKQTFEKINKKAKELIAKDKFIFLLGGEHSVSVGVFDAMMNKYNPKDVTILHIDAHCDLRYDDSDYNSKNPSKYAHSAVMRRASEMGYPLVQVGIRTYSKDEYEYFNTKKNNVKVFEWSYPAKKPEKETILKSIKTKYLYISIDVDGFDPSVMPGTGTPVPGGLKWNYGMKLLMSAVNKKGTMLIGADIVEVSPQPHTTITEYASAQLLYNIITEKFKNKSKK
ncbi:MAG: agmatinase [bacterium]|nr:agmatinase [bacterium]